MKKDENVKRRYQEEKNKRNANRRTKGEGKRQRKKKVNGGRRTKDKYQLRRGGQNSQGNLGN